MGPPTANEKTLFRCSVFRKYLIDMFPFSEYKDDAILTRGGGVSHVFFADHEVIQDSRGKSPADFLKIKPGHKSNRKKHNVYNGYRSTAGLCGKCVCLIFLGHAKQKLAKICIYLEKIWKSELFRNGSDRREPLGWCGRCKTEFSACAKRIRKLSPLTIMERLKARARP